MTYEKEKVIEFIRESNLIEEEERTDATIDSLEAWRFLEKKKKLNFLDLLEAHRLAFRRIRPPIAGKFRNADVFVGGERKKFVSETLLIHKLTHLLTLMRQFPEDESERGAFAKRCHIIFEDIHPHEDGNGRIGRLLMNWHRLQMGIPIKIIKSDWPKENGQQARYYKWFS